MRKRSEPCSIYLRERSLIQTTRQAERIGLRSVRRRKRSAADALSENHPTGPFCRSQIHYILANPVYAGLIRHKNQIHEGQHPAIIDRAVWDEVQVLLASGQGVSVVSERRHWDRHR